MVSESAEFKSSQLLSKSEQPGTKTNACIVAADIIRTAEVRMQQRGMLPGGTSPVHNPFWFLVETEKNVFLWRSGCSLADKERYDFWVDIDSLLDKRIDQLKRNGGRDPLNSGFENFDLQIDPLSAERQYLETLRDTIMPILNHLSALSEVQREIINENTGTAAERVVLPYCSQKTK